jgi:mercuric ion binding protein
MRQRLLLSVALLLFVAIAVVAAPAQLVLRISGMHCGSCATGIRAMLQRTEGVLKADVSYEERRALVDYDPAKTSPDKIVAAVEKMGYKAEIKK